MSEVLKKFGKFFLLDLVAQGGMAEVYRARMATPDGGARFLAIKKVLPSFSQNQEFVSMFKSEIKTTSGFTHPNVVQIYDFGEHAGQLYLAMELVEGKNLRQFLTRTLENKKLLPVELSAFIVEQSAAGLHYAHVYKDKITGKPLEIVHRDVSPQNILISYDGSIKVIDFGIAKAETNIDNTRTGIIKGKPSYLSPEQISGDTLDGRSDLFALGAVLWEMLVGRKLFSGENDFAVIKQIETCDSFVRKPSDYNAKVPPELDLIVMKCLKKKKEERYQTADELHRALRKFIATMHSDFSVSDISVILRELFKKEILDDREKMQKLNEKAISLITTDATIVDPKTVTDRNTKSVRIQKHENSYREIEFGNEKTSIKLEPEGSNSELSRQIERTSPRQRNSRPEPTHNSAYVQRPVSKTMEREYSRPVSWSRVAAAVVLIFGGVLGYYFNTNKNSSNKDSKTVLLQSDLEIGSVKQSNAKGVLVVQGNVNLASVIINGKTVAEQLPAVIADLPTDVPLKVTVFSNGYQKYSTDIRLMGNERKTIEVGLTRELASTSTPIVVKLNILPRSIGKNTRVLIADESVDPLTPVGKAKINEEFEIVVEREGYRAFRQQYKVDVKDLSRDGIWSKDITLHDERYGLISIKTNVTAEVQIEMDGHYEMWTTPVIQKRIPTGDYELKLMNRDLGLEKVVRVKVEAEKVTFVDERLTPDYNGARVPARAGRPKR